MRKVLTTIDNISGYTGGLIKYFCFLLILVVVYGVVMRYVFNNPPMWAFDTAVMLGGSIYVLAFAYTHRYRAHVRVDVIYANLSPRVQAIIDAAGAFLLLFPLIVFLIREAYTFMVRAWEIGEIFRETAFYPPAAPFRTVVFIGFCLLGLQSLAIFFRDMYYALRNKPYD